MSRLDTERWGEEIASLQDDVLEASEQDDLAAAKALLLHKPPKRPSAGRWLAAGLIAAAAAAALIMVWPAEPASLVFHASGETADATDSPGEVGSWLAADELVRVMSFSDGSTVELEPGAILRVSATDSHGATLDLQRGAIEVSAIHRTDTSWRVHAGPFDVVVVGTRFRVSWDPDTQNFGLDLHEGEVRVEGPEVEGRGVRTGEILRVCVPESRLELVQPGMRAQPLANASPEGTVRLAVREATDEPTLSDEPLEHAQVGSAEDEAAHVAARAAAPSEQLTRRADRPARVEPSAEIDWRWLAREGRCGEAIAALPLQPILESGSAPDLLTLTLCGVRASRPRTAERAARALRTRFAGSAVAGQATYRLGIMEQGRGDNLAASRWLEESLQHDASGPYSAVAMAALMQSYQRTGQAERGARIARTYLRNHPDGSHTEIARELLDARPGPTDP